VLTIDFETETARTASGDFTVRGFSLNGGTSWTEIMIDDRDGGVNISRALNGGANVMFAERLSANRRSAAPGSAIWEIGSINRRPAVPRLSLVYGMAGLSANADFNDENRWYFGEKPDNILITSSADGRNPDRGSWVRYSNTGENNRVVLDADGEVAETIDLTALRGLNSQRRVQRTVYFVRTMPEVTVNSADSSRNVLTPVSSSRRVTVSGMLVAPRASVNYNREIVALRAGIRYRVGATNDFSANTNAFTEMTRENTRAGVSFETVFGGTVRNITGERAVQFYTASTGRRPRSVYATITVHGYREAISITPNPERGFDSAKNTYRLPKGLEVFNPVRNRWVTSIRITENVTLRIRERGNARFDAGSSNNLRSGTRTASHERLLRVNWGDIEGASRPKQGVLSVELLPLQP
jgi:hypothetical protein